MYLKLVRGYASNNDPLVTRTFECKDYQVQDFPRHEDGSILERQYARADADYCFPLSSEWDTIQGNDVFDPNIYHAIIWLDGHRKQIFVRDVIVYIMSNSGETIDKFGI